MRAHPTHSGVSPSLLLPAVVLALASGLWGCGYHLSGARIPEGAKTVAVPVFHNQTFEPVLENAVTAAVKEEFLGNGRLALVNDPDGADLVLKGTIIAYGLTPLSFDRLNSVVLEYRVQIRVQATLENGRDGKVIWEDPSMETEADYLVNPDTAANRVAQDRAISQAAHRLAENIVTRVLEGP